MPDASFRRARTSHRPKPWYVRGGGARFRHDDAIVRACQPGLAWKIDADRQLASLEGVITLVEAETGVKTPVSTRIEFERDYPESEPVPFETAHRFAWMEERHINERTGQCCLWLPPLSRWSANDPEVLRTILDELALFFDRQLIYDVTHKWPGSAWAHGAPGYWEFVVESLGSPAEAELFATAGFGNGSRNEPCPCRGGQKYKHCHLRRHEALARRIRPETRAILSAWRSANAAVCGPSHVVSV